jgi:hypothetical protein
LKRVLKKRINKSRLLMLMTTLILIAVNALGQVPESAPGRELFSDPAFDRGFTLTAASHPGPKVEIGALQTTASHEGAAPSWRMPQWGSRELLQAGRCSDMGGGQWGAENRAKRVLVEHLGDGQTGLRLEVRGDFEYDGRMRAAGEPWPHLLIEQCFDTPVIPKEFKTLSFAMEARIPFCKPAPWSEGKRAPGLHTAQVSAFWTVHNVSKGNPDCGDMIWFGIPFFDARHEIPPAHYALDSGKADASGKFICMLDGKRFWKEPTGNGSWQKVDADLLALVREGLTTAQQHGYLQNTKFEDLSIDSFNLGWEIPGPYDAAFEVRGLSMQGEIEGDK